MSQTQQRIVLVTGASRGIGRAAALALAKDGAHVIAVARSQKALEQLDDEIKQGGFGEATLVPLDLKDYDAIDRLGEALAQRYGRLDGLCACAGVLGALTPASNAAPRVIEETLAINYIANQRLIRALHPLLRLAPAGRAVFVSSSAAQGARAYWGPYGASKAALEALVRAYASELEITNVRANLYNPGATRTAMRAKAYPGEDPMTLSTPEDVVGPMIALLRPDCALNGQLIKFERTREDA